jgi:4-hydroxy-tetrahydrodipicolinate synthase
MFTGSMVAIVTPYKKGKFDETGMRELIEFQIKGGTDVIVPCGTTGEASTMTHDEHKYVIQFVIKEVKGRIPVVAGAGSNSTAEAVELVRFAKKTGADGVLVVTPYYNKPTQKGLIAHYTTIAQEVDIPIIPYNVPGRTAVNMLPETVAQLAKIKNIVGIKEASGNLQQITEVIMLCGPKFSVLSGDDFIILPVMAVGGKGIISVVANIVPAKVAALVDAFNAGDLKKAAQLQLDIFPLCQAMFYETNPIPVKTALSLMKKIDFEVRLPLCAMSEGNQNKLQEVMKKAQLI